MSDVVVTVPMRLWEEWIAEGDLPGDPPERSPLGRDECWSFVTSGGHPRISIGERVYVVAYGRLRGYAPLTGLIVAGHLVELQRRGGAVAVTLDEPIRGFRGWRYRWWSLESERPFPGWREP